MHICSDEITKPIVVWLQAICSIILQFPFFVAFLPPPLPSFVWKTGSLPASEIFQSDMKDGAIKKRNKLPPPPKKLQGPQFLMQLAPNGFITCS